jgi:hypothetical protein
VVSNYDSLIHFNTTEDMTMADTETFIDAFHATQRAKNEAIHAAGGLASNMTLRDAAALKALAGVMATCQSDTRLLNETSPEMFARKSYEVADAMLEARKTTGEGK